MIGDLQRFRKDFSTYTELRVQENSSVAVSFLDGRLLTNARSAQCGASVRAWHRGKWGFASSPRLDDGTVRRLVRDAARNARLLSEGGPGGFKSLTHVAGSASHAHATRRTRWSQNDIVGFLRELDGLVAAHCPGLASRWLAIMEDETRKSLLTSEGSSCESLVPRTGLRFSFTIESSDGPIDVMDHLGGLGNLEEYLGSPADLLPFVERLYRRAREKAEGVHAEAGLHECIIGSRVAGILAHEAVGHTAEADFVLMGSVAGEHLGREVASPLVNMVDFAHTAFGRDCPVPVYVDDEGTPARDTVLIDGGRLTAWMHNKSTAAHFGHEATGHARAYGFHDEPLIRMRNTCILPGKSKLEDMIGSIRHGYFLEMAGNGQADATSEFMFGITTGREIVDGKLGRAIRDTTISGVAFEVLKSVSAVSDELEWTNAGMCGKKQSIQVGMGGPSVQCKLSIGGR